MPDNNPIDKLRNMVETDLNLYKVGNNWQDRATAIQERSATPSSAAPMAEVIRSQDAEGQVVDRKA